MRSVAEHRGGHSFDECQQGQSERVSEPLVKNYAPSESSPLPICAKPEGGGRNARLRSASELHFLFGDVGFPVEPLLSRSFKWPRKHMLSEYPSSKCGSRPVIPTRGCDLSFRGGRTEGRLLRRAPYPGSFRVSVRCGGAVGELPVRLEETRSSSG